MRRLRVGLPAFAVAALTILLLMTWFNPLRFISALPLSAGSLVVSGSKITMEAPKITGYTSDNRAYSLTATSAAQDFSHPDVVELAGVRGRIELQDKGVVNVSAASGVYNANAKFLTLNRDIVLTSSTGYEGRLSEATFDVRTGHVISEKPVEVLMLNGVLNANRLEMTDNGAVIRFEGGVSLTLTRKSDDNVLGELRR